MLERTGTKALLEKQRSGTVTEEINEENAARGALPIAVTPKKGSLVVDGEQRMVAKGSPDGSPESSNSSSISDSPPESRSLPVHVISPIAISITRAQSVANDGIREEIRATRSHHRKQGWGEWIRHTFWGGSSANSRELAQVLLSPADRTDELAGAIAKV